MNVAVSLLFGFAILVVLVSFLPIARKQFAHRVFIDKRTTLSVSVPAQYAIMRDPRSHTTRQIAVGTLNDAGIPYPVKVLIDEVNLYLVSQKGSARWGWPNFSIPLSSCRSTSFDGHAAVVHLASGTLEIDNYAGILPELSAQKRTESLRPEQVDSDPTVGKASIDVPRRLHRSVLAVTAALAALVAVDLMHVGRSSCALGVLAAEAAFVVYVGKKLSEVFFSSSGVTMRSKSMTLEVAVIGTFNIAPLLILGVLLAITGGKSGFLGFLSALLLTISALSLGTLIVFATAHSAEVWHAK